MPDEPGGDTPKISESQLQSWKLLGEFRRVLNKVAPDARPRPAGGPERLLAEDDYLASFLFAQFNPVIDTMRGLCACSDFRRVQEEVCGRHISLGSFSEAQQVFGSARLHLKFNVLRGEPGEASITPGRTCERDC